MLIPTKRQTLTGKVDNALAEGAPIFDQRFDQFRSEECQLHVRSHVTRSKPLRSCKLVVTFYLTTFAALEPRCRPADRLHERSGWLAILARRISPKLLKRECTTFTDLNRPGFAGGYLV